MPTYHARGVSVRLGITPLADTVNPEVVLNKANIDKKRCEEVDENLLKSELLREKRVNFPGDDLDFELNWLGNVPFMQTQVGHDLFRDGTDDAPGNPGTTVDPSYLQRQAPTYSTTATVPGPLALSLHVTSSDRTFISGLDKQNKLHLKIEVLFNGQLSTCFFFPPYEVRSGTKTHHQVFAGYRTDYLVERPWVILPPQISADGRFTAVKNSTTPEMRWKDICQALSQEAAARGSDKYGNLPPSATFLRALAEMEMPHQIKAKQKRHTRSFGVIDVLITAGVGKKVTSGKGYLKAPQRFIDEDFSSHPNLGGPQAGLTSAVNAHADQLRPGLEALVAAEDEDAESESDLDIKRPSKRRAVTSSTLQKRRDSRLVQPIASQTSAEKATKSTRCAEAMPRRPLFPETPTVSHTAAPFPGLRDGVNDLTSSPERGRADPNEYVRPYAHHLPESSLYHTPQEPYSFPSSSIGFARTPQMLPSPYSFQFPGPASSEESRRASIHMPIYSNVAFPSSPLQRGSLSMNRPVPQSLSHMSGPENGQNLEDYTPSSAMLPTMHPILPRRSSFEFALRPSSVSAAPKVWSDERFNLPRQDATQSPAYVPNMVPGLSPWGSHANSAFGSLSLSSPYDRRYSMPLPQAALFSVTTKPKLGAYAKKRPKMTNSEHARRTFQLRRLVIIGKEGVRIVDHTWAVSRCITLKNDDSDLNSSVASSTPASLLESSVCLEAVSSRRLSGSSYHVQPVQSDPANASHAKALHGSAFKDFHGKKPTMLKHESNVDAESVLKVDDMAIIDPAKPLLDAPPISGKSTRESTPQRRIASGKQIRGVQGPKATTFWLDDPEEILRGLGKARRSRPPVKRKDAVPITAKAKGLTQVSATSIVPAITSSSPLSSVPTTPEIESGSLLAATKIAPTSIPTSAPKDPIPQLDGSHERSMPATLLPKPTPLPTKLDRPATPRPSSAAPTTSPKKRKTPHRSPSKNAGRHKTVDNPPLNQNCVIAFAESKDKESEKGVLRQVKSERQGVFNEEYGVFAVRFYVAGN